MPKQTKRPSDVLRDALAALTELKREMPQSIVLIGQCERQVKSVIDAYDAMRADLALLAGSTRRPPQRVPMRARKKPVRVVLPKGASISPLTMRQSDQERESVGDYDMEHEAEMRDRFGHDIPDGSD